MKWKRKNENISLNFITHFKNKKNKQTNTQHNLYIYILFLNEKEILTTGKLIDSFKRWIENAFLQR